MNTKKDARQDLPFGGVHIIITGDFYQLPPVKPLKACLYCGDLLDGHGEWGIKQCTCGKHGTFFDEDKWAFCSPVWDACNFENVELKQVHRQVDPVFTEMLHTCRKGLPWTAEQQKLLLNHKHNVDPEQATKLTPTRAKASAVNDQHMRTLTSPSYFYDCIDSFAWQRELHPNLQHYGRRVDGAESPLMVFDSDTKHRYEPELELKKDEVVLLITNINIKTGLINGSIGKIIGFLEPEADKLPRARKGKRDESREGEPLLVGDYQQHQESCIRTFAERLDKRAWPIVKFQNNGTRVIYPSCMITELGREKPYSLLSRAQIPLLPGWAITIHKSQGMTLEKVVVDLDECFEKGQAYVALSRARSLNGLVVESLPKEHVVAVNREVEAFYEMVLG